MKSRMTDDELREHCHRKYFSRYQSEPDPNEFYQVISRLGADLENADPESDEWWKHYGFPEDWRELARHLRTKKKTLEFIYAFVRGIYSPRHPTLSEVHRAIDPDGAEKHAQHQREYVARHPERRAKTQADYYARNRETLLAKQRERRRKAKRNS